MVGEPENAASDSRADLVSGTPMAPQEAPPAKISRPRQKKIADLEYRALGIIVGYLTGRFGKSQIELGAPLGFDLAASSISEKVKNLVEGCFTPKGDQLRDLRGHLSEILSNYENNSQVQQEYALLWSVFVKAGIDVNLPRKILSHDHIDKEFLRAININFNTQGAGIQKELHKKLGGLWYIIRRSTRKLLQNENTLYNISLLNIKPVEYSRKVEGKNDREIVNTDLLHFTLIAPNDDEQYERANYTRQIYRGRLIEFDRMVYFIGNRDPSPRMFMMAMPTPQESEHAKDSAGIVMTVSSSGTTISAPIECLFDPTTVSEQIKRHSKEKTQDYIHRIGEIFEKKLTEGHNRVRQGSKQDVLDILSPVAGEDIVARLLDRLEKNIQTGTDGYFSVSG